MNLEDLTYYYNKFKFGEDSFHDLMKHKVKHILLVSTFYDAFIFEQDGRLSEQIFGEYRQLNLSTAPRITSVPTAEAAIELLKIKNFDLVITGMRIGNTTPFELAKKSKKLHPKTPVLLLVNVKALGNDIQKESLQMKYIDNVFSWQGDSKIFLAMVKYVEDRLNVYEDTENGGIRVILLVEDSIAYYSRYLPMLYELIVKQTQLLISQELSDINKRLRMRARPKVLLCHTFEEAVELYEKYKSNISAVISDVSYPFKNRLDKQAGFRLINYVRKHTPRLPMILQSSQESNRERANLCNTTFLNKFSKTLIKDLKSFLQKWLGYGDFIFRNLAEEEIDRAKSLEGFEKKLKAIDDDIVIHHAKHDDFSTWLYAHGEFGIAKTLKELQLNDFETTKELKKYLIKAFTKVRNLRNRGKIINFREDIIDQDDCVIRLAEGSLGGKGRGLAFLNSLLVTMEFDEKYPDVYIRIPTTFIIGTTEYDKFIEDNGISRQLTELPDEFISRAFLAGSLSNELTEKLKILLQNISKPLAIRSSGLLEDSQAIPFAGVYETFMIPNNSSNFDLRLSQLANAIKMVYASVFYKNTRDYIEGLNYKLEEEKMAVIIQEIGGRQQGEFYYPHLAGVAQSHNFYTTKGFLPSDGIASVALGMGKTVVDGGKAFKFVPNKPKKQILSDKELLGKSQKKFYAINLENQSFDLADGEAVTYSMLEMDIAEKHKTLHEVASVWDFQNNRFTEDLKVKGPKVINFANIIKYETFPLAKIISDILEIGEAAMGVPVEIEFACDLTKNRKLEIKPDFYMLQIRPLSVNPMETHIDKCKANLNDAVLYTEKSMGNGKNNSIYNIIYLNPDKYNNTKTLEMQTEIAKINEKMRENKTPYLLMAPGRWGSSDRFLGIPVRWDQINYARIIVELTKEKYSVDASQGTHFFHNLIAQDVGYLAVPHDSETDFINWDWIEKQKTEEHEWFTCITLQKPLEVTLDGKTSSAIILKPKENA